MKPGPRKTPTALALVRGNPGRRPLPKNEPKPPPLLDHEPPEYLADIAKDEWRRVCPLLAAVGLMSKIDVAVLAAYCGSYAELVEATEKQRGRTTIIQSKRTGNFYQSPFVSMIKTSRADMVRYASELGMTPSARASMDINIGALDPQPQPKPTGTDRYF